MSRHSLAWIEFTAFLLALIGLGTVLSSPSDADPFAQCDDSTSCSTQPISPGVRYCPDTGGYITPVMGSCPSLWVGPYSPGGLSPNGGTDG